MDVKRYHIQEDLKYTKEHEWAKEEGVHVRIGISDYAAKTLNDVVFVDLPKPNQKIERLKSIGTVESIKAVSEIFAPISGVVTTVNDRLGSHPELVNKSPYGEGWLAEVKPSNFDAEAGSLLDAKAYAAHLETLLKE